jgi:four helix bundle protein
MDTKELIKRTKKFGYDCIDLTESLSGSFLKNHVRGQLIRCSTSVGANYRAARLAQSEASFIAKVSIVIEEADESSMWLEMMVDKSLVPLKYIDETKRLILESYELASIFIATRKTMSAKKGQN